MYRLIYLMIIPLLQCPFLSIGQNIASTSFELYEISIEKLTKNNSATSNQIALPFPNGERISFEYSPNELLSEELQTQYPDLLTYDLFNQSMKGKMTVQNGKIYVNIRTLKGMLAILPSLQHSEKYKSYYGSNDPEQVKRSKPPHFCGQKEISGQSLASRKERKEKSGTGFSRGGVLTTYRLAIVTTGEFEDENGANSMARITSTVQGWNLIYETDLGVSMNLVNTQIYTDPATDPFQPDDAGGDDLPNQAAEALRMNFADNTYDIGHVFHHLTGNDDWSGTSFAGLGVVCDDGTFFSNETPSDGLSGPNK
ncbi:MAG: reprolysin-like metallopeptidase, partial [Bacteroidota bacterium]